MKNFKAILLGAVLSVGAFSTTFVSCTSDPCSGKVCANGGTCNTTTGACDCKAGYEGADCKTLSRAKFLINGASSSWKTTSVEDNCLTSTSNGYIQTFSAAGSDDQITVTDALGYNGMVATVQISGNSFSQIGTATSGNVTLSNFKGVIDTTLNPDKITFTYTSKDLINTINCVGSGLKQ